MRSSARSRYSPIAGLHRKAANSIVELREVDLSTAVVRGDGHLRVSMGERSRIARPDLGSESLNQPPSVWLPGVAQPVVEAVLAVLPELEHIR